MDSEEARWNDGIEEEEEEGSILCSPKIWLNWLTVMYSFTQTTGQHREKNKGERERKGVKEQRKAVRETSGVREQAGSLPHMAELGLQRGRGSGEQQERKSEAAQKHFHTSYRRQRA